MIFDSIPLTFSVTLPWDADNLKSTLVQITAWCGQATSHNLYQNWRRFMSSYSITRLQWVKGHKGNSMIVPVCANEVFIKDMEKMALWQWWLRHVLQFHAIPWIIHVISEKYVWYGSNAFRILWPCQTHISPLSCFCYAWHGYSLYLSLYSNTCLCHIR